MKNTDNTKVEIFKSLHDLQYDRISKIETQNNYITSFVTGLSTLTIAYSFKESGLLTFFNGLILPCIFIIANIIAVFFLLKARTFIKMHQSRAQEMRKKFAPDFHNVYLNVGKEKNGKFSHRTGYMALLHILISLIGLIIIVKYFIELS